MSSLSHSYILDIDDDVWSDVFTDEEKQEFAEKVEFGQFEESLPENIVNCLSALDKKV